MNFFKSVFSDDPDPSNPGFLSEKSDSASRTQDEDDADHRRSYLDGDPSDQIPNPNPDKGSAVSGGGWNFGGFIQTLTSKSESVLETYRRDLKEFGSGLRKELEIAQGSLETVGHTVDDLRSYVLKETSKMIAQGKDAILAADVGSDSDNSSTSQNMSSSGLNLSSKRYNRFDAQVRLIQSDVSTYSLEPEDLNDYNNWKYELSLDEKTEEIKGFLDGNDAMSIFYKELVPKSIESETFWSRYYYKVFKLKQAEDLRAKLVSAISKEDEELSWDVDGDDDDDKNAGRQSCNIEKMVNAAAGSILDSSQNLSENNLPENDSEVTLKNENLVEEPRDGTLAVDEKGEKMPDAGDGSEGGAAESSGNKGSSLNSNTELSKSEAKSESDDKMRERKDELGGSKTDYKDSSKTSKQPVMQEEEDLGWDEIEDLSSIDEIKPSQRKNPSKAVLSKQLTAAVEEDLSWEIEDDDDPAKS